MFFSVRNTIKIAGKVYKPCICYEVTSILELTVNKLVAEEKADTHKKYVYFCNGKVVEAEEEKTEKKCSNCDNNLGKEVCTGNSKNELIDTTGELKCWEKKQKKTKKEVEEEISSPEEIANEGF